IDGFHAHRLAAVVHVRLEGCDERRLRQPEVTVVPDNLVGRNIEIIRVTHVLRERDILWNRALRENFETELNGDRRLFTSGIQVEIEIDLRPRFDETAGV